MIQEGDHNVAIGRDARMGSSGNVNYNVVAGSYSLNQLTNAYNNVVIGYNCSGSDGDRWFSSWHSNVVLGYQAGNNVPSAASNVVIGKYTCGNAGSGQSDNVVIGTNAGKYLGSNSNNCVILGQELKCRIWIWIIPILGLIVLQLDIEHFIMLLELQMLW